LGKKILMKKNETVLVTGASSGIGRELSIIFAREGYDLVLVARDGARLNELAEQLQQQFSSTCWVISQDLSQAESAERLVKEINEKSIHIDVLVNNAGFSVYGELVSLKSQDVIEMIQVNITALTSLTRLLLPAMLERKHGKILNLASTGSFVPGPFSAVYCASKAYILSFTEAIAEELKGTGVTATALCPGATQTEFAQRANMEDTRLFKSGVMDARIVAEIGYQAMIKGKTMKIAGTVNNTMIFFLRLTPRVHASKIAKIIMS